MIGNDWDIVLKYYWESLEFKNLYNKIINMYNNKIIYPNKENIFNALKFTSYKDTYVVIIGQDPYHEPNEANGLSFSVSDGVKIPPSLKNIYKELSNDLKIESKSNGNLEGWAKQGVLLLNTVLTVEKGKPGSHENLGWEILTDNIIKELNKKETPIVFILWGKKAQAKSRYITNNIHYIIKSAHPSPFSAYQGFFNSKPFSKTNNYLKKHYNKTINWSK